MIVRHDQLAKHLSGQPRSLYVVFGDDPVYASEAADAIRKFASANGFTDRDVITTDGRFDWSSLSVSGSSLSLFAEKKFIDLRIPSGSPGKSGGDALKAFAANPGDDVLALVVLPELDWQAKKTAWFSALESNGLVIECTAPGRDGLPKWLAKRLAIDGYSANQETLEWLADRVFGNLLAAQQEVFKIGLLHPKGELSLEDVQAAVVDSSRYDIEDIRAAFHQKDLKSYIRAVEGVRNSPDGNAKELLIWHVANDFRTAMTVKKAAAIGGGLDAALKDSKVFGDRREQVKRAVAAYSFDQLLRGLKATARIDRINKGVEAGDIWLELTRIGIEIMAT